jgi:hypothetical protein
MAGAPFQKVTCEAHLRVPWDGRKERSMSENKRMRAMARLVQDRGMSHEAAELIARALFPLDTHPGGLPVSRRFPKRVGRRTKQFRKAARSVTQDAVVDLAFETIEDYRDLAVAADEAYYVAMFEEMTAHPAPWASEAVPDTGPDSMVDRDEG